MKKIDTVDQFEQLLESREDFYFLKHSLTCPVSASAFNAYQVFTEKHKTDSYYLAVQESRPLSNHIAEAFHTKHESPQVFHVKNGQPVWNTSHFKINEKSLEEEHNK
ncbi:bacillithiol system redox-active protein YtxJ [Jeotgalibacillus aurantiacus]|uniref:bacillithiol system redox-active protein YtxJ n=1 Tax=Jeotgalibacillus aurantiacus TaxID=2763266 RepID=UPI001D0BDC28|nr:bacillithiol system redox-active protein YtxJ [Jeotgalibacillus aurantiacus]